MISLSSFQKKFKHSSNRGLSFDIIGRLKDSVNFDFQVYLPSIGKNLQRGLVWTLEQKQAFIVALLKNQNINPIVVIQNNNEGRDYTKNYEWEVIDGKQRLTTVIAYLDNEFPINIEGVDYFYENLPDDCKRQIFRFDFKFEVHYSYWDQPITDQTKIELFELVNFLGTPQDIEHLNSLKK